MEKASARELKLVRLLPRIPRKLLAGQRFRINLDRKEFEPSAR